MKNPIKQSFAILLVACAFLVSSCSKDTIETPPQENIEQGSELANLMQRTVDNSNNQNIDCIDFVYPLTFFVYDSNQQQTATQTVNNDTELLSFLLSLQPGFYIEMDFPISVVLQDGTVVEVNSNSELLTLILDCSSTGNDPFPNDFETILTTGSWFVTYFFEDEDETSDFAGYEFFFATDNTAQAINATTTVNGTWNLSDDNIPNLEMDFGENDPFDELDEDWDIVEATNEIIKLKHVSDDGGDDVEFLTLERTPGTGGGDPTAFTTNLTTDSWYVNLLEDDGENETCHYVEYEFTFNANQTVTAVSSSNTVNGTWAASGSGSGIELDLNFEITGEDDPFDDLNDDWDVQDFNAELIKLFDVSSGGSTDYLYFGRNPYADCNGNPAELETILIDGQWKVGSYIDDGVDETGDYTGYAFTFNADGTATAANSSGTANGTWDVMPGSTGLELILNFEIANGDDPLDDINDDWDVTQFTTIQIDLEDVSGGSGGTDLLSFIKL